MTPRARHPRVYDHTDGDLILIHAARLAALMRDSHRAWTAFSGTLAMASVSLTLWLGVIFVRDFRELGVLGGETVRLGVIGIAAVLGTLAVRSTMLWLVERDEHHPDIIMGHLTSVEPVALPDIMRPQQKS